jgi:hypothetical protein
MHWATNPSIPDDDVTYFIEKKGWTVDQLLQTRLTQDETVKIMRANGMR